MSTLDSHAEALLEFWFGKFLSDTALPTNAKEWFAKDPQFDESIRRRYGHLLGDAVDPLPENSARERLAKIIVLDQFPRNMFRQSSRAFAFDHRARTVTRAALTAGDEEKLRLVERVFLYLPLEHSEDLSDQRDSVAKYEVLAQKSPPALLDFFKTTLFYAQKHFEIINRFGRFPHRNEILKRESSEAELIFLKEPHSSF